MDYDLLVITAFSTFRVGQRITDPSIISAAQTLYPTCVFRVPKLAPGEPEPSPPTILSPDRLTLVRDGTERVITIEDLVAYLAPLLGGSSGGSGSTGGDGSLDLSNPDNAIAMPGLTG